MQPLRTGFQQFVRSGPAGSRIAAAAAAVLGLVAIGLLVLRSTARDLVPLPLPLGDGAGFSETDAADVRARISAAGLPEPVERDGRLLVPAAERERYRDVVNDAIETPPTWAESWEAANATLNQFSLSAEREDVRDITRAKLTSRLLNELPGIEQADVVWDEERQPGWNRPPLVRATVYLRPRPGHRITLEAVHAVRRAVAGSKAYLNPENVVVMDLSRLVAFDRESLGDDFDSRYGRISRLTAEFRQRAEDALSDIPGASVAVAIDADAMGDPRTPAPPPQRDPESTGRGAPWNTFQQGSPNTGLEVSIEPPTAPPVVAEDTPGAEPSPFQSVTVSVSVPTSHYRQLAAARRQLPAATEAEALQALAAIEQEVTADVRDRLSRLGSASDPVRTRTTVTVQSVDHDDASGVLLVAPSTLPGPQFSATRLAGFRSALIAVTVLMAAWLLWKMIRGMTARTGRPDALVETPQATTAGGGATDASRPLLSRVPADQLSEVLNDASDDVVARRLARPTDPESTPVPAALGAGAWDIDELAELSDAQLRKLVRSVAIDMWPAALSSATPSTRRRLLSALPDGEADQLRDVLSHVRPIRLDEIDQAQLEVHAALASC